VVRNDVYARFAHDAYNKGTALAELARQIGIDAGTCLPPANHFQRPADAVRTYARWLAAPRTQLKP